MIFNRFAVVLDWENSVSAERECVQRIWHAAQILGLECDIVDTQYRLVENRNITISNSTHDFVLHVHFCSGKAENVFSIATLWNPIDIYHNWGYRKSVDTLMTNDDFVSENSSAVLTHVSRLMTGGTYHLFPELVMYPAPPDIYAKPSYNARRRLFYSGINWERLNNKNGRYHELFKILDETGLIDIYGPRNFQGIKPWAGFKSYKGEIPFDGSSMMEYLKASGVSLVLSSESHIKDGIITNRLFEALSAGVVVIADQNPIIRELMGDTCLYVNSESEGCHKQILSHLNWLNTNPDQAMKLAQASQAIYEEQLSLCVGLKKLYAQLEDRKQAIHVARTPEFSFTLNVFYFLNDEGLGFQRNQEIISRSILANSGSGVNNYLISSKEVSADFSSLFLEVFIKNKTNLGAVIFDVLPRVRHSEYYSFVLPCEELFDNHLDSIIKAIAQQNLSLGVSDVILKELTPTSVTYQGMRGLTYARLNLISGAFVFRSNLLDNYRLSAIRQMDLGFVLALVVGNLQISESRGFTCKIHHEINKMQTDKDIVNDLRLKDWFEILTSDSPSVGVTRNLQLRNSVFRKFYNRHYSKLSWLRRYPSLWFFLKSIFKPLM